MTATTIDRAKFIVAARKADRSWTTKDLAKELGTTRSTVIDWLRSLTEAEREKVAEGIAATEVVFISGSPAGEAGR